MEAIKANEINEIIRSQIENFDASMTVAEVGTVIKVGDGIAEIHGLEKVMAGELLEFPFDVRGLALNLEEDKVGAVLFGDFQKIKEGDEVKRTRRIMSVPVGRRWLVAWLTRSEIRLTEKARSSPTIIIRSSESRPELLTASR